MKREELILQSLSELQLAHAKKIIAKELKRRSSPPPAMPKASGKSGTHRKVTVPHGKRKVA